MRLVVGCDIHRGVAARAHPDWNQGLADLQSAALTTVLCTRVLALNAYEMVALT